MSDVIDLSLLGKMVSRLQSTVEDVRQEYKSIRSSLDSLNTSFYSRFAEFNVRLSGVELGQMKLATSVDEAHTKIDRIEADLAAMRDRVEAELAAMRDRIEAELAAMRDRIEAKLAAMRDRIEADLPAMRDRIEADLPAMRDRMEVELTRVTEQQAAMRGELTTLNDKLDLVLDRLNGR